MGEKNHEDPLQSQVNTKQATKIPFQEKLNCMYTNADCLSTKWEEFRLRVINGKPKIICITEVKPKHFRYLINLAEYTLEDYETHQINCDNKEGRGIIVYTHKSLECNRLEVDQTKTESIWLSIRTSAKDRLLLGCIYRTDSKDNTNNLCDILRNMEGLKFSHYLVLGDFNYRDINWGTGTSKSDDPNHIENRFLECIRDCYWQQHVHKPTRGRGSANPNVLDLIFTNEVNMVDDLEHHSPLGKSDHCVLLFNYICYIQGSVNTKIIKLYNKANYPAIREELTNINWDREFSDCADNVNQQWDIFARKMKELEDRHIPTLKTAGSHRKGSIPLDKPAIAAIKKKHRSWNKYIRTKSKADHQEYCRARNKAKRQVDIQRRQFERNTALNVKDNPKGAWKYIKSKYKTKEGVQHLYTDPSNTKSELTQSDSEKAEVLSAFFSSVFVEEDDREIPIPDAQHISNPMAELTITEEGVYKLLSKLQEGKSPGPDQLHPKYLTNLKDLIAKPITMIFQTSIKNLDIPNEWKEARISAIFKKGNKKIAGNYRPVSLTCILCKTLEKIVREHIIDHMKNNNFFSKQQYGFISKRSTTLQLLKVMDEWTTAWDQGLSTDVVYMDFKKAFDTVPHKRLMKKLESYGISNPILGWVQSFLTGRSQYVSVEGQFSKPMPVLSGVPQGSVLGPILFVVYINDLPTNIASNIYLFADDTKLFKTIKSTEDRRTMQEDLGRLQDWSDKWLLQFHPDKCKCMTIGQQTGEQPTYSLRNKDGTIHKLKVEEKEKDLGVTCDNGLTFEEHICEKVNKANQMAGVIRRSYKYLTRETFVCLYKALVRCHLDYAACVWSPFKVSQIEMIESVQRRATRCLPGLKDIAYEERLKLLNLPTLTYRRLRGDMIETYKIVHSLYDPDVSPSLPLSHNTRDMGTRGHQFKLYKERSEKRARLESFPNRIVNPWNSLPEEVVNAPSLNAFKNRLDKHWRNQDIVYNYRSNLDITRRTPRDMDQDVDIEAQ